MPRGHTLDLRWNALLNDFRRSGLTHAEFCLRRGISIHSFRKRLYRVPTEQAAEWLLRISLSLLLAPTTSLRSPAEIVDLILHGIGR